ncbi:MAG: hypothetical protein KGI52_12565 [Burkholderiales bacterium]|nr:hypothetical protein [Burkholderiales bacterium]
MARSRNIKPGFFTNDDLGEMDPLARLLFAGMWTIADRAGRLEDRPKKIKAEVLPYDNCDADAYLSQLADRGFILRYEFEGKRYIQILAWEKHQNPHCKEAPSTIPAPSTHTTTTTEEQYKHSASTVLDMCESHPFPERAGLIPDSLHLDGDVECSDTIGAPATDASTSTNKSAEVFPIHEDWKPSASFAMQAKLLGLPVLDGQSMAEGIAEFVAYWIARPHEWRTQAEWDHALAKSLKHRQVKSASVSSRAPPGRKSTHAGFDNKDYTAGVNADGSLA